MPTKVRRAVAEAEEEIAKLEIAYLGQPQEARIRLLRIVKSRSDLTFEQAADAAGVQRRSAYRWWKTYRTLGVTGLLNLAVGRPAKVGNPRKSDGFRDRDGDSLRESDLLVLINGMPMQLALLDGINGLRDRLITMFADIDRISIQVNTYCDLEQPQDYRPNLSIAHHPDGSDRLDEGMNVRAIVGIESPSHALLDGMRRGGFPFDQYREPVTIDLWLEGTADLGALVLWRAIHKTPISDQTLASIERLKPFLVYVFSNLVTRHHYANPGDRVFYSALMEMAGTARLTAQEQRVISYRLMGYSYKRIASETEKTVGAVKKQLASVHRKTGTSGHGEFFAKYFSPRLLPPK